MPRTPQYLVDVNETYRQEKPWLISSKEDVFQDKFDHDAFISMWQKECPFPGIECPDKLPWLSKLQKLYEEELQRKKDSKAPDAFLVATAELLKHAPKHIHLEVRAKKSSIRRISNVNHDRFHQGLMLLGRADYHGEMFWEPYRDWLMSQEEEYVTLGSIKCNKTDETTKKITEFVEGFGFENSFLMALLIGAEEQHKACREWGIMRLVGENLYIPHNQTYIIPIRMAFQAQSRLDEKNNEFLDELRRIRDQSKLTKHPRDFICVAKTPSIDKRYVLSRMNTHVLWLPEEYERESRRINGHFWGEGETRDIIRKLMNGKQEAHNLVLSIAQANLQYLKSDKVKRCRVKFACALALTTRVSQSTSWMSNNSNADGVKQFILDLGDYWRNELLTKTDRQLGIDVDEDKSFFDDDDDDEEDDDDEMSRSRRALYHLLGLRAKALSPFKLDWEPVNSRKRKQSPTSVTDMEKAHLETER